VFAKIVAQAIKEVFPCRTVGIAAAGLEVAHAHIHLLPINEVHDMGFGRPKLSLPDEEMNEIAEKIRKAVASVTNALSPWGCAFRAFNFKTMQDFLLSFQQLMDPEYLLSHGGFYIVCLIVFAETGLFFGFFLPGDYLLFLAGLFCALNKIDVDITTMYFGILISGILGNFAGYWFGHRAGPMLFKRKDSFLFKRKYVVMAEEFYHKYGGTALVIGRFVPIIRTFAPIFAGVV